MGAQSTGTEAVGGHVHSLSSGSAPAVSRRARRAVTGAAAAAAASSLLGMALLWPTGSLPASAARLAPTYGARTVTATVRSVRSATCAGGDSDRLPDGTIPAQVSCPKAGVLLTSGAERGEVRVVPVPATVRRAGLGAGDHVTLDRYPGAGTGSGASQPVYAWHDYDRRLPLTLIVIAFAVVVVVIGRARGLAALGGLAAAYVLLLRFVVPALLRGENADLVALTGSVAIMSVVLYLAHGVSVKTATAHVGTTLGLGLTAVLAPAAAGWAHLQGLDGSDAGVLTQLTGSPTLSGFVVAGIVIAGLGVLNDVTISQASAVFELKGADPGAGYGALLRRALRIGRDHLASSVYTLAFAYAGTALPTLALLQLYGQPLGAVLTSSSIAEEVVRTALGGACLVLAVPVTTAVAAAAAASRVAPPTVSRGRRRGRRVAGRPL